MTDYNGWSNYATWRVNLEIFDGLDPREMGWAGIEPYDLAPILRDYAEALIDDDAKQNSLARDYAMAFIDCVNYREIARVLLDSYSEEVA